MTQWSTVSPGHFCHSSVPGFRSSTLSLHSSSSLRYSLTEEGQALAERLESAEHGTKSSPEGNREEVRSEGEEEEEDGPGVVDLTGGDDDGEEESSSRHNPAERLACVTRPRGEVDGMGLSGKAQDSQATSRRPNAGCLLPGTYEIILCVDFIETTG